MLVYTMEQSKPYKLDRSLVVATTVKDADDHITFWLDKSLEERLNAACFIINQIYGVTSQTKVDRTIVSCRKHEL